AIVTSDVFRWYFFFFQAEDGIRDFHVTGVQTCALPISPENGVCRLASSPANRVPVQRTGATDATAPARLPCGRAVSTSRGRRSRTEERRVGKECRSRWAGKR